MRLVFEGKPIGAVHTARNKAKADRTEGNEVNEGGGEAAGR
jgi:hypothetical protein